MAKPVFNPDEEFEVVSESQDGTVDNKKVKKKPAFNPDAEFEVQQYEREPQQEEVQEEELSLEYEPTVLSPEEEEEYQNFMNTEPAVLEWKDSFKEKFGEYPETDKSNYDYRGAFKSGQVPVMTDKDDVPHWGSIGAGGKQLKSPDHPTRWKSEFFEATGKDPDEMGVTKSNAIKTLKLSGKDVSNLITSSKFDDPEYSVPLDRMKVADPERFDKEVEKILKEENKFNPNSFALGGHIASSGYLGDFTKKIAAGGTSFVRSLFRLPALAHDIYKLPQQAYQDYMVNKQVQNGELTEDQAKEATQILKDIQPDADWKEFLNNTVANNPTTKFLEENTKALKKVSDRYDKSIEAYLKTGEYQKALGAAGLGAGESLIPTLVAAFTGGAGLATVGATAAAEKKAQISNKEDIAESVKVANAIMVGSLEVVTERMGTHALGGLLKGMWKKKVAKGGAEAFEEVVKKGFKENLKRYYTKFGIYTAPVQEGLTEAVNQFGQNITDILTGVNPDMNPFENVIDAFSIGTVTGVGFTSVGAITKAQEGKEGASKKRTHEDMLDDVMAARDSEAIDVEKQTPEVPSVENQAESLEQVDELQAKTDALKESGVDVSNLSVEEIEDQHKEMTAEKPAVKLEATEEVAETEEISEETDKVSDFIESPAKYKNPTTGKNEAGHIKVDGQQLVFETNNQIHELGNVNELEGFSLKELGLSVESPVAINDDGSINFRDKNYQNNYTDPTQAINVDEDGNVTSVNLDTEDGSKRTFRGQAAEDIAYEIHMKETATDPNFDKYLQENEQEIEREVQQVAKEQTIEADEQVQEIPREEKEVIKRTDSFPETTEVEAIPTTEDEYVDHVIENSQDPKEIAGQYLSELEKPAPVSHKEQIINDHLGKIKQSGYEQFGDAKSLEGKKQIVINYFSNKGQEIDQEAQQLEGLANVEITENDIVNFMDKYPGGNIPKGGGRSVELAKKYKDLTGKKLSTEIAQEETALSEDDKAFADAIADEMFGPIQEQGLTAETIEPLKDYFTEEEYKTLQEYYENQNETTSAESGESGSTKSKGAKTKKGKKKLSKRKPERSAGRSQNTRTETKEVNSMLDRIKKAFPNVTVITDPNLVRAESSKKFADDTNAAFVSDGVVFINPEMTNPFAAVEEFAHLWIHLAKATNKSVYNKGLELVRGTQHMQDVLNNPAYANETTETQEQEALAKAIADKSLDNEYKGVIVKIGKVLAKPLRKMGLNPGINLFDSTLDQFTNKASKEVLSTLPIANIDSDTFAKIRDGEFKGSELHFETSILDHSNWGRRVTTKGEILFSPDVGGRKLTERKRAATFAINEKVKKSNFIVKDLNDAISEHAKSFTGTKQEKADQMNEMLDSIQDALTNDISSFADRMRTLQLPADIKAQVVLMRNAVDKMSQMLKDSGAMVGEELEAILDQNMGVYLNRSYAKHSVDDYAETYRNYMTDEQYANIVDYLRSQYESTEIKKVSIESKGESKYITFTNKTGLQSEAFEFTDVDAMESFIGKENIDALRDFLSQNETGEFNLKLTDPQEVIPFSLTPEQIKNQVIPAIVGESGSVEALQLGRPIDTMGIGTLETGIFKKKNQDLDENIRILLGEYVDPRVNFTNSIVRMASAYHKGNFESQMIDEGENTFFTKGRTESNTKKITLNESARIGNSGYYTTPEIFETLYGKDNKYNSVVMQALIMLNGMTKASLTIFKDDSQARNFTGAFWNQLATGRLPMNLFKASGASMTDATDTQKALTIMSSPLAITYGIGRGLSKLGIGKTSKELRDLHNEAVEYGLIGENLDTGILEDIKESINTGKSDKKYWDIIKSKYAKATEAFSKPYQASDEIFKISQWISEVNDFKKIYPNKSESEIKRIAAEKVRRMQPTYSLSPKIIRMLSKTPIAGSFVQFQAQMWQTRYNILTEASKEIKEGVRDNNPKLRNLGAQRLLALSAASSATPIIASLINSMNGWDKDDEENYRRFQPSYSENSTIVFLNNDKKNPRTMDLSFMDPSSNWHKMITAAMRGEDIVDSSLSFASEGLTPFANSEIFTQKLIELANNRTQYGQAIYSESKSDAENAGEIMTHTLGVLMPGIFNTGLNVYKGAIGYETDYGKVYDFTNEVLNSRIGVKTKSKNMSKTAKSKFRRTYGIMNDARKDYQRLIGKKSVALLDPNIEKRFENAEQKSKDNFDEMLKDYQSFIGMGFSKNDFLKLKPVPKYMMEMIIKGEYYGISKETGKYMTKREYIRAQNKKNKK